MKIDTRLTQLRSQAVPDGRVYFIRGGDFIKIGFSLNPLDRLSQLQSSCPFELELLADFPGTLADELAIMATFAHFHIRGEWFRCHPEILDYIHNRRRKKYSRGPRRPNQNLNGRDWIWI